MSHFFFIKQQFLLYGNVARFFLEISSEKNVFSISLQCLGKVRKNQCDMAEMFQSEEAY